MEGSGGAAPPLCLSAQASSLSRRASRSTCRSPSPTRPSSSVRRRSASNVTRAWHLLEMHPARGASGVGSAIPALLALPRPRLRVAVGKTQRLSASSDAISSPSDAIRLSLRRRHSFRFRLTQRDSRLTNSSFSSSLAEEATPFCLRGVCSFPTRLLTAFPPSFLPLPSSPRPLLSLLSCARPAYNAPHSRRPRARAAHL
eukprot:1799184-Pleurochrysis_carterae.AAC.1